MRAHSSGLSFEVAVLSMFYVVPSSLDADRWHDVPDPETGTGGDITAARTRPARRDRRAKSPGIHQQSEVNYLPRFSPQLVSLE